MDFQSGEFDAVVDKGTLDSLLVDYSDSSVETTQNTMLTRLLPRLPEC